MAESIVTKYFGHIKRTATQSISKPDGAIRHGAESLAGGLVLGAIHAEKGLDIKGKIPADALGAAVGYLIAGKVGGSLSDDIRTLAGTGMTSFGFRQGFALMAEKRKAKGLAPMGSFNTLASAMHGEGDVDFGVDAGEDPIVALARQFPG